MPELPEVETIVRELQPLMAGQTIDKSVVHTKKIRIDVPENLPKKLKAQKVLSVTRRAKYILINLENGHVLIIHLGMSGRIHIRELKDKTPQEKHDHLRMSLSNGKEIIFNDPRRFGLIAYVAESGLDEHALFSHLGPEPFDKTFTAKFLEDAFRNKKTAVKIALMDQTLVVGVGNIYACEALYESGIDPALPAQNLAFSRLETLAKEIRNVLKRAIKAGGSTLKDYRKTNGDLGYFQHKFSVYDREGRACGHCDCRVDKTGGVQRMVQGGRSTFYCPRKQV